MKFDRRSEVRELMRLPVAFESGASGVTWDVSPHGVSVEFNGVPEENGAVEFSITLLDDDRPLRLKAHGQIVWVKPRGERYGIGVQIIAATLETADQENAPLTIH